MDEHFDIVVLGSGIAGSITAMVLARCGLRTLVVERKTHPRFVIGESTIPTTTLLLNHLATTYDIPELAQVGHYLGLRENGCAAWPKQVFWYGVHREGGKLADNHEVMFEAVLLPNGPDVHMLRADADAFLASRMAKYGVSYEENTEVLDFRSAPGGAVVRVRGPAGERDVNARLVIDATGHASFLAKRFDLRDESPALSTNTRSIFAHFKDVPPLDDVLDGLNPMFRFQRNGGTMHHCFPGGWVWVIPFDNGVTSVGFQLDRNMYPLDETISPEEEIRQILARFPTMKAHLGDMLPVRPVIRADRIQFTSKSIVGDGFILAPHAAGFIEPLFSTGIVLTLAFVARLAPAAKAALAADDFGPERFRHIERLFFAEIHQIDRLVNGVIQSFRDYDLFKQYWRNWVVGTLAQFGTSILVGGVTLDRPMLYGSGVEGFPEALERMHTMVCKTGGDDKVLANEIKAMVDVWFDRVCRPVLSTSGDFSIGSDRSCAVLGATESEPVVQWMQKLVADFSTHQPAARFENAENWFASLGLKLAEQQERYRKSQQDGSDYHKAYDRIIANQNPEKFDYYAYLGIEQPH